MGQGEVSKSRALAFKVLGRGHVSIGLGFRF